MDTTKRFDPEHVSIARWASRNGFKRIEIDGKSYDIKMYIAKSSIINYIDKLKALLFW